VTFGCRVLEHCCHAGGSCGSRDHTRIEFRLHEGANVISDLENLKHARASTEACPIAAFTAFGFVHAIARLQPQLLEVVDEVLEDVADTRVVAVAQDGLVLEMLRVMPQLFFDVGKLGVKLVLLGPRGGAQASIQRLGLHFVD